MKGLKNYFSNPEKIRDILLVHAVIFTLISISYYYLYLSTLNGLIDRDGNPFGRDFTFFWRAIQLLKEHNLNGLYTDTVYNDQLTAMFGIPMDRDWRYPPHFLFIPLALHLF